MHLDFALYVAHALFWISFALARAVANRSPATAGVHPAPAATQSADAPHSRALLAFHMVAFGVLYAGIGNAVLPDRVPAWFPGQRPAGALVIAAGAALAISAVLAFRSWRFRAAIDAGHELATGGPFAFVRHPIYLALTMLALGSALWAPTPTVWLGFALMAIGGDLRARAEEKLLARGFGDAYRTYCAGTARFIPRVY